MCNEIGLTGNIDKVCLTFEVSSNVTVDNKGTKTLMIKTCGNEKMCNAAVLACCADGLKLLPCESLNKKHCLNVKLHMEFIFMFISMNG